MSLKEYPLQKVLDSFPLYGQKHHKKLISLDTHPWVLFLQRALERFVLTEVLAFAYSIYLENYPLTSLRTGILGYIKLFSLT